MTIQELKDFFSKSDFSEASKSKIMSILEGKEELGNEVFSQIKVVMQEELDNDFKEAGVDISNDPSMQQIQKEYDDGLNKIESELKEDMSFVENELKHIEELRQQVTKIGDTIEADKIAQSIHQAM